MRLRRYLSPLFRLYPDHLTALEGVFGFNMIDTDSFQGVRELITDFWSLLTCLPDNIHASSQKVFSLQRF